MNRSQTICYLTAAILILALIGMSGAATPITYGNKYATNSTVEMGQYRGSRSTVEQDTVMEHIGQLFNMSLSPTEKNSLFDTFIKDKAIQTYATVSTRSIYPRLEVVIPYGNFSQRLRASLEMKGNDLFRSLYFSAGDPITFSGKITTYECHSLEGVRLYMDNVQLA